MPAAGAIVTIARAPEEVFDFIADGKNNLLWRAAVLEVERGPGTGVGEVWHQWHRGPGGRKMAADYEITEFDRPNHLAFRVIAGPARPEGLYELQAVEGGTKLSFRLSWTPRGLARLLSRPVQRAMEAEVAQVGRLKSVLESR